MIVVGGGPAGLAAASAARELGAPVLVAERKRSVGRKFLIAGKGGLNLTHSEPLAAFLLRYRESAPRLEPFLRAFPPEKVREFAASLGQDTFVGTSGRVFPREAKAAPLLRAWVSRLKSDGVRFRTRSRFAGLAKDGVRVVDEATGEESTIRARAVVLALGGGSWPQTGSDGGWVDSLRAAGVDVADLASANAGVEVAWPKAFLDTMQGRTLKGVVLRIGDEQVEGDLAITRYGLEGTPIYSLNPAIRAALAREGRATLSVDLKPGLDRDALAAKLGHVSKSLATQMRAVLSAEALELVRARPREPGDVATRLKSFPVDVTGLRPLAEAISSAGGVRWSALDDTLMLRARPGVFVAGEMIDWEAPTGGYLLQACLSTGAAAGAAAARF